MLILYVPIYYTTINGFIVYPSWHLLFYFFIILNLIWVPEQIAFSDIKLLINIYMKYLCHVNSAFLAVRFAFYRHFRPTFADECETLTVAEVPDKFRAHVSEPLLALLR